MLIRSAFFPARYGGYFSSLVGQLNTAETIFTPAANVRGGVVYSAHYNNYISVGAAQGSLIAKAAAPGSLLDGDVLLLALSSADAVWGPLSVMPRPVYVPPGFGLYRWAAETGCRFACSYTLY